jgi:hypothetical protein
MLLFKCLAFEYVFFEIGRSFLRFNLTNNQELINIVPCSHRVTSGEMGRLKFNACHANDLT